MGLMVLKLAASLVVAGVAFLAGEWLRWRLRESNEVSRKLVHVIHGLLVASWSFVMG
jgi:hypothetical protein